MPRVADDSTSRGKQSHLGQVAVAHHVRGVALVTMRGEHDLSSRTVLARALQLAAAHSNVVVDLSECSFIDSMVINEFIKTWTRASGEQIMLVPEYANLPHLRGHVSPSNRRIVSHGEG
jgi:hypothetical protein